MRRSPYLVTDDFGFIRLEFDTYDEALRNCSPVFGKILELGPGGYVRIR